jgi:hypothetical protein
MKKRHLVFSLLLVVAVVLIVATPIGPLPGFFIGGEATATPQTWPDTAEVDEIYLKVPGTIPRVVIIWVVQVEGELYVVGSKNSGWVQLIGSSAPVEMRLRGQTYALNAVSTGIDLSTVIAAYKDKYRPDYPDIVAGFPSVEEGRDEFGVFRLTPRAGT